MARSSPTKFKKYLIGLNKCVANHFHLKNHVYTKDLVYFIVKKDILLLEKRLSCESFLINLFKRLYTKLINYKIPKLFAYN